MPPGPGASGFSGKGVRTMALTSLFRRLRGAAQPRPAKVSHARRRLTLEVLEDRTVLSANLVADVNTATLPANPVQLTDVNGTLFFFADNGDTGRELYRT